MDNCYDVRHVKKCFECECREDLTVTSVQKREGYYLCNLCEKCLKEHNKHLERLSESFRIQTGIKPSVKDLKENDEE